MKQAGTERRAKAGGGAHGNASACGPGAAPAAPRRAPARKGEGDRLREEIAAAAEALLIETGSPDAVSIRSIAARVGVAPAALYLHFPDKERLFYGVCAQRYEEFRATLAEAFEAHDDPLESLLAGGRALVRFGLERPETYQVLFMVRPSVLPEKLAGHDPAMDAFTMLVDVIRRGMDAGVFRQTDPFHAAVATWTSLHGFLAAWICTSGTGVFPWPDELEPLVDEILANVWIGLASR